MSVLPSYSCTSGSPTSPSLCSVSCGNSIIDPPGEDCEDGNTVDFDGCSAVCSFEPGWTCVGPVCQPICGDNFRVNGETCDDGNSIDNQGCLNDCSGSLPGFNCVGGSPTTKDVCSTACNDGFIRGTEQCEDGNLLTGDGCSNLCMKENGWTCSSVTGPPDSTTCIPICGDGLNMFGEICDDGVIDG